MDDTFKCYGCDKDLSWDKTGGEDYVCDSCVNHRGAVAKLDLVTKERDEFCVALSIAECPDFAMADHRYKWLEARDRARIQLNKIGV